MSGILLVYMLPKKKKYVNPWKQRQRAIRPKEHKTLSFQTLAEQTNALLPAVGTLAWESCQQLELGDLPKKRFETTST